MELAERLIRHPGLDPLWRSIEREHRLKCLTATGTLLAGILATVFGLAVSFWFPFLGSVAATLSIYWLVRLLGNQPVAAWREDLREHPERFRWVYGVITERMPYGLSTQTGGILYIYEDNGDSHSFSLPADQLLLVTKTLNRLLPLAEFGYTEEREMKYRGEIARPK